jgi:hypothetical protein
MLIQAARWHQKFQGRSTTNGATDLKSTGFSPKMHGLQFYKLIASTGTHDTRERTNKSSERFMDTEIERWRPFGVLIACEPWCLAQLVAGMREDGLVVEPE